MLENLNLHKLRHLFYLIVDFVDMIQVARPTDIHHFLNSLEVRISNTRLNQLLFVLTHLELLTERRIMNSRCYSVLSESRSAVEYGFHEGGKRSAWKIKFFEVTQSDGWRRLAFSIYKSPPNNAEVEKNVA
jgi:hypothetical protein